MRGPKFNICSLRSDTGSNTGHIRCVKEVINTKGRHQKKNCFFSEKLRKGGRGVSPNPKFPYQKKMRFFWHKGGGLTQSKMVLSEKMRFFGIFCQKGGILSEKTENFSEFFAKRGGVSANPKNPYQKNLGHPN